MCQRFRFADIASMVVRDFTIEKARHGRINDNTRAGYMSGINQIKRWLRLTGQHSCIKECPSDVAKDFQTLDLTVFTYDHFLEFLERHTRHQKLCS